MQHHVFFPRRQSDMWQLTQYDLKCGKDIRFPLIVDYFRSEQRISHGIDVFAAIVKII